MNYDPMDTCPYDEVHRVRRSRMQFHLTKCSVQYPCANKKKCPFDARHHVNPIEYNYHIETCPARETVVHYKLVNEEAKVGLENMVPIDAKPVMDHNDDWDDHEVQESYNPQNYVKNNPVVHALVGASKAQRKKHRMNERLRVQQIEDQKARSIKELQKDANQVRKASQPLPSIPQAEQEYKPLRRPKKQPVTMNKPVSTDQVSTDDTNKSHNNDSKIQNVWTQVKEKHLVTISKPEASTDDTNKSQNNDSKIQNVWTQLKEKHPVTICKPEVSTDDTNKSQNNDSKIQNVWTQLKEKHPVIISKTEVLTDDTNKSQNNDSKIQNVWTQVKEKHPVIISKPEVSTDDTNKSQNNDSKIQNAWTGLNEKLLQSSLNSEFQLESQKEIKFEVPNKIEGPKKNEESKKVEEPKKIEVSKKIEESQKNVFSYAAALSNKSTNKSVNNSFNNENDLGDKENLNSSNVSILDRTASNISKTLENLSINDERHKEKSESLNQRLLELRKQQKNSTISNHAINLNTERKSRCAATFSNLNSIINTNQRQK